jgi:undecaprenyl-diphosphatase
MHYFEVLLLGVIQGIAEFLPISSKGHLVLAATLLHEFAGQTLPDMLEMTIVLHVGTLASIVVVYWHRLWRLFGPDRRVIGLMVVGTLPAVVLGLPLHEIHALRQWFEDPLLVGCLLPVTGLLLIAGSRVERGKVDYTQMTYAQAFLIGCCQSLALLPGISRSGTTIVAGLLVGLRRDSAATFSFFLAIPAILGAAVLASIKLLANGSEEPAGPLAFGVLISFVVGVASLKLLLRWLNQGHLAMFAWWCIPVGLAVVVWQCVARFL